LIEATYTKDRPSPGEAVRENYRRQGERRMLERIIRDLEMLDAERQSASWSPRYVIDRIKSNANL
jgi:hypothetical protein